ncbi:MULTISPECIES: M16 family metallopeptidase [unclassified Novosphingobium]|uniref:M16 family metallopeptidase n=1 Tax=unclassified Novosphingobium TaxID=2644732 RepID=UPI00086AD83F|nr:MULTISPECIES: insulinase family protein [unclassified Novosphingobium]MBN9144229.1 insulinase family protein [Novosphingobium sp.]MDR6708438.1 zinc protease [Novosphingobium sp. 1748]ODU81152.1 MAG: peptidase M16 [Novosphingobium sp. SCN 63-17]OJX94963.1 MAG: peptidase M16 [Novosphingobium sp. 63-713]
MKPLRTSFAPAALFGAALFGLVAAPLWARPAPLPQHGAAHRAIAANIGTWPFQKSDIAPDPAYRFGQLPNGMRYILRHNETPKGEIAVRMRFDVGSLDEGEQERGFAHFVEHMAFQGSTHVAQGEMVRLLERKGLAFGAHTNAFTTYETTTYHLDLPRNTPDLIDTALMLMRETAGELTISPESVSNERGVILSEKRDRNNWQYREAQDRYAFVDPKSRYLQRSPIGTEETLGGATAEALRAFWRRNYVPEKAVLVMVGDFDVVAVEAEIRSRFGDWAPSPAAPQPSAGPIDGADAGRNSIYLDPSLSEHITITRRSAWRDEPDTWANRRKGLAGTVGYAIINRRLQKLSRRLDPPFRAAQFGTNDIFHAGRDTAINVDSIDGRWRRALTAATTEVRRAIEQGFTQREIDEQVAVLTSLAETAAAREETQGSVALANAALGMLRGGAIPSDPNANLAFIKAQTPGLTPERVLAAVKADMAALDNPLIRFTGRRAPDGGADAIRTAWNEASTTPLPTIMEPPPAPFAYTDFGAPGRVVEDKREPFFGIREIRFANGVRLNLKRTTLSRQSVLVHMAIDGGQMLATSGNPLAVEMTAMMGTGGLGKHTLDEMQSLTAGHLVSLGLTATGDSFNASAGTRPKDLLLQLQMMAALITDPGYRQEGENIFHQNANTMFLRLRATPSSALQSAIGGILSDNDPRFTLQPVTAYRGLTFAKLKADISERLQHGAIEIGLVGDLDEEAAIADVARTFGALPPREAEFRQYDDQRKRPFTSRRGDRTLTHTGPADQALIYDVWPTRDDRDPNEKQVFNMLQRVVRIQLTETLRQKLGRSYSPSASSDLSRVWRDYGTFAVAASVDVNSVDVAKQAIDEAVEALAKTPPSDDLMLRARQPLLETIDNTLNTNGGWLGIVALAQSEPDQIERQVHAAQRLRAVTPEAVQAAARRYLAARDAVRITVLPASAAAPEPSTASKEPAAKPQGMTTHESGFVSRGDAPAS